MDAIELFASEVQGIRYQVEQAGERIRKHAKKCALACFQMGKELVAIRPMVDELYPKGWIKWSQKHTQGLSRSTVWRWMEVAENFPEADIADETKLIEIYRKLGLSKKKQAAETTKPDSTLVSHTVTVTPFETPIGNLNNEDKKDTGGEISGHGDEDEPPVSDLPDEDDGIEDDDEQEDGCEDEEQDKIESEDEQNSLLGKALDIVYQMEELLHESTLLSSHVKPLKELLIRLSSDVEVLV